MGVPFDWMETKRNPDAVKTQKARREAMYRTELEERAGLLHRLGHSKESARARLHANVGWDFERGDSPVGPAQVDGIVEKVFGSVSAGKAAPRAKGGPR
jgi:hypothetical protein